MAITSTHNSYKFKADQSHYIIFWVDIAGSETKAIPLYQEQSRISFCLTQKEIVDYLCLHT